MDKIKKILKNKLILGIIIGISITSTVVYAAYIEATEIRFTSSTGLKSSNVQDAIEEISKKCSSNNSGSNEPAKTYKCKRATTLHTEICDASNTTGPNLKYGCEAAGYNEGDTIPYGSLGTKGTLKAGDAFDCDVNGDGTYDSATERFYYISNYYDTQSKTFNNDYAVLLYYNNVSGGESNNTSTFAYYTNAGPYYGNNYGPQKDAGRAYYQLPSTSQWSNISLYKTTRAILNKNGENTSNNGNYTLPSEYSYGDKAARFLTYQELNAGCPNFSGTDGDLDKCQYLLENTTFKNDDLKGYWLETPHEYTANNMWAVNGLNRGIITYTASSSSAGVRPVIEVLKSDIDY